MPRERAASSKCRERQDSPTAFTSFPDFSKINDEPLGWLEGLRFEP